MTANHRYTFTPASNPILRWLTEPGANVPAHIRQTLLGELFNSPTAILMGVINGLLLNGLAVGLHGGRVFILFAMLDCALSTFRYTVVRKTAKLAARGLPASTDTYIFTGVLWCALQGAAIFMGMRSGIFPIQIYAGTTAVGLMGPICARNYPAPRLALLLGALCALPFAAALLMKGEAWTLILFIQVPIYFYGCYLIITRYQSIALDLLLSQHESHRRAAHDPLTGLLNRTGFEEQLTESLLAAHKDLVLFFLDLDGFKTINDNFGHEAGDLVLKGAAGILKDKMRAGDIVARLGGDEFVIAAPDMSVSVAERLATFLTERIGDEAFKVGKAATARVGVSIGYACFPDDGASIEDLLRKADMALYAAKRGGRGIHRRFRTHHAASPKSAASALEPPVTRDGLTVRRERPVEARARR